jgi:hypothetical protein
MVRGERRRQRFPDSTPMGNMTEWIEDQRTDIRQKRGPRAVLAKGTFEADVEYEYLPQIRHLAAYYERWLDIKRWACVFRGRNRNTITPIEIRKQISAWAAGIDTDRIDRHGGIIKGSRLAPATLNHRMALLRHAHAQPGRQHAPGAAAAHAFLSRAHREIHESRWQQRTSRDNESDRVK